MSWYSKTALGKETEYRRFYDPSLLCPLARAEGRQTLRIGHDLPFHGVDIWHNYEASWLNTRGKPEVAIVQLTVPAHSPYLIESKSLKLYFNSLNFKRFDTADDFIGLVRQDLSKAAGAAVDLVLLPVHQAYQLNLLDGVCLDELDIACDEYLLSEYHLRCREHGKPASETLFSHLLRSNCPVTSQPDWGSICIKYQGQAIDHEGLLRYLVSFREHNDFHEQCVERIFTDIMLQCRPEKLTVQAYYTRRGGLDINPFRSNWEQPAFQRLSRQ
jgi:7-cyano-7-deazaguanine reductase